MGYKQYHNKKVSQKDLQEFRTLFNQNIIPVVNGLYKAKQDLESRGENLDELDGFMEMYDKYVGQYKNAKNKFDDLEQNGIKFEYEYQFDESNLEAFESDMNKLIKGMNKAMGYEDE